MITSILAQSDSSGVLLMVGGIFLLVVLGLVIVFPLFWCAVSFLISVSGDWKKLSAKYAAGDRQPTGAKHTGILGWVGKARYKYCLILHFADDGLFIETHKLFRVGHPRLFIPWAEVSHRESRQIAQWKLAVLRVGSPLVGSIGLPFDLMKSRDPQGATYPSPDSV